MNAMKSIITLILLLCVSRGHCADPFLRADAKALAPVAPGNPSLSITYEAFSIGLEQAAALQRADPGDAAFYNELVAKAARGEAKQECLFIARGRSGQKFEGEGATEIIYPTAYEKGRMSGITTGQPDKSQTAGAGALIPPVPTAFETRNCGFALEVAPILSQDQSVVDLNLIPRHTTFINRESWGQGDSEVEMPVFDCQRVTAAVSATVGTPCLIGTISRVQIPGPQESSARRIWFAFVTVDIVKE